MQEHGAFLTLLRRLLIGALFLALLLFTIYLGLVRQNRARSYERGLQAINKAHDYWPAILANLAEFRDKARAEFGGDAALLDNPRFLTALESLPDKHRERILLEGGAKALVYLRVVVRTNNAHIVPLPGNSNLLPEKELWLPANAEIIAAQQDMLLSDFIANSEQPTWALDPLELERRLNANPGVISCALIVSSQGGYERALAWIYQLLLLLLSFLIIFVPAYVWQDTRGRYRHALLWTLLAGTTNLAGLLVYLLAGRVTATTCYECNQAVNDQQKFCPYCRVLLKTECRHCGQPLGRNWRYCANCGTTPEQE